MVTLTLSDGIDPSFITLYICILLGIAFLALLANTVALTTIYSSSELRRPLDFYMANLAASDIVLVFSSTFTVDNAKMQWSMGKEICKLCFYSVYLSYTVTTLTLCVMSIELYHGICKPLQHGGALTRPFQKCRVSIPVLWLVSALLSSPNIYAYGVQDFIVTSTNKRHFMCEEKWSNTSQRVYSVAVLLALLIAPIVLVAVTFGRIIEKLNIPLSASSGGNVILHKKRKRISQMLLVMIAVHLLCWSPTLFSKVVNSFSAGHLSPGSLSLWLFFELVHFGRSFVYPLIYVGMHKRFRSGLSALYQACPRPRRKARQTNNCNRTAHRDGSAPGSSVALDRSVFYYPEDELCTDM